jgi:putative FmdB family regulatory protein
MPIYEYACRACGAQRDVMQKVSEPPLTQCPACGAEAFEKKVSAAGFQLKGGGWYVTDFRDGSRKAAGGTDTATNAPATSAPASTAVGGDSAPGSPAPVASPASVD